MKIYFEIIKLLSYLRVIKFTISIDIGFLLLLDKALSSQKALHDTTIY